MYVHDYNESPTMISQLQRCDSSGGRYLFTPMFVVDKWGHPVMGWFSWC